ncbi:DUF885 domain-containing protein [Robertkochia marina]|uniref:DUF885 domain-containing protein n=1 Tax=Robertkochia marina TaxID=1227945 RepID=A0A4S3M1U4_9FLAO|nr:DUF885 domain-containing protein [Robertkochia marina]THD69072.1 DUF885 domain-containing protein [Robertkochia marina]TRZ44896.1 DUF885 domain-containing protein [Robertkochia marina]
MKRLIFTLTLLTTTSAFVYGQETTTEASKKLEQVIEEVENFEPYDRKQYPLGNFTDERFKASAEFADSRLRALNSINESGLTETERISLELLKFVLQDDVDAYRLKTHHNPIQADQGFHLSLNYRIRPLSSAKDARRYLYMLGAIPEYTRQHIALLQKGLEEGISQPKVIFKNYASTYDQHIVGVIDSSDFFSPLAQLPGVIPDELKDSIIIAGRILVRDSVIPSFKKIKKFFEEEYIPNTRDAIGVSDTPGGKEYYQNRINFFTTTEEYTAEDIHELGMEEVARIKAEMMKILEETGFEGSLAEFMEFLRTDPQFYATTGEELLKEARDIAKRIDAQLPAYFKTLPRRPYGVKKVPDAIAPIYTGGRYNPPSAPTQPGYYLVNTYKLNSRPLYVLPSLTAHEAVPGHHLQMALNSELGDSIPGFRKNLYLSAYGEGWALYTETLAGEMGIYTTPYERFGKLTYEMWRACRLVVDTGIHAFGWSRQEVVDFMTENTALSIHEINTETDRYIAWPGQAISYKMGELKIRELRALAEKELGENFDIREFHERILEQGTVTLPILEERIKAYIHQEKSANTTP